jgi:fumarylacetoacetate (FAA) hydrolase family protein
MDMKGKETFINSMLEKTSKNLNSKNQKKVEKQRKELEEYFGKELAEKIENDINS